MGSIFFWLVLLFKGQQYFNNHSVKDCVFLSVWYQDLPIHFGNAYLLWCVCVFLFLFVSFGLTELRRSENWGFNHCHENVFCIIFLHIICSPFSLLATVLTYDYTCIRLSLTSSMSHILFCHFCKSDSFFFKMLGSWSYFQTLFTWGLIAFNVLNTYMIIREYIVFLNFLLSFIIHLSIIYLIFSLSFFHLSFYILFCCFSLIVAQCLSGLWILTVRYSFLLECLSVEIL